MSGEGVIKFHPEHRDTSLAAATFAPLAAEIVSWRAILRRLGMVGREAGRYDGFAFGNLSARLNQGETAATPSFLITGSQTGGKEGLTLDDFCVVEACDPESNRVVSHGPARPSAESLTHDAVYRLDRKVEWVFHVHSPELWGRRLELGLPSTASDIAYGTAEMAREVGRLYRRSNLAELRIFAMAGHQDGLVAFGASARDAGETLIRFLARSLTTIVLEEETL
ncbi:MAG TPA: class II aldolase/adducin family protein [Thermoanaerobaculia bacterium]|nr:class II aldolase/adducin family protein [Thermoanaerobaculia bacterium]